jgi:HD-GYP domain-containing protein (c-di-GMP phosphodiesterase class II)
METKLLFLLNQLKQHCNPTFSHSLRVGIETFHFAQYLGLYHHEELFYLGSLHDIGKIRINSTLLNKKGRLSESEFAELKKHTLYGQQIIKNTQHVPQYFHEVILLHHENVDGSGYFGKKEKEIPFLSRIIRIIDSYDTMLNGRIYQSPIRHNDVMKELYSLSNIHYDKELIHHFSNYQEWKAMHSFTTEIPVLNKLDLLVMNGSRSGWNGRSINYLRSEMIRVGLEKGFTHPETIRWSQRLDTILLNMQLEQIRKQINIHPIDSKKVRKR